MPYFTQRLVDDFASHIRLYRRAMDKAKSVTVANKEGMPILKNRLTKDYDFASQKSHVSHSS